MNRYLTTIATWEKLAAIYRETFMNMDLYRPSYDRFIGNVTKDDAHIFEIGCGPGMIAKYISENRPKWSIDAIDVAHSMVELARQYNPTANIQVMDARNIHEVTSRYNGVICGFCLPYLAMEDIAILFANVGKLLHSGGVFYISWIRGSYYQSGYVIGGTGHKMYVYYYSDSDIRLILDKLDFIIIDTETIVYTKSNNEVEEHVIYMVRRT